MRLGSAIASVLDGQRGHLFPWAPVCFGVGIGVYFALSSEPSAKISIILSAAGAGLVLASWRLGQRAPLLIGCLIVVVGFGVAKLRTHVVAGPVLGFRYYGPIEGRIVRIDRSASDKVRLTLDRVVLARVSPERTPDRVRVSLHGLQGYITPEPGLTVILTGHLSGPDGPVEPGGFDFQRKAWFQKLGAVGYTRTPVLALYPADEGRAGLLVHRIRAAISGHVQSILPGRNGAFAAAITTGDRSGMDKATLEALRKSNLAHLLAISGLHMGMLTGFLYGATRYVLALWPRAALSWPVHKIGAGVALVAGALYLALSGGNVATERAFIMVAVMLTAVMFDRRALTLRAVALAALIVLTLRPEALLGPGFQMSFAATTALIWVFSGLRETGLWRWHPVARWTAALIVSSAIAGLATAPIAAAHFNRVPHFGLIANLLSVPVMGGVVMPAAVLAATLAPFGLSWIGLKIMSSAIAWILAVADRVAALDGSVSHVPTPQAMVVPVLVLGALWLILWQGRVRWAGTVPMVLALLLWTQIERPQLLVSGDGGLVGLMTEAGRAMSKPRGQGFAARSWLENDGDAVDQEVAAERDAFRGQPGDLSFDLGGMSALHLSGRGASERAPDLCEAAALVIVAGNAVGSGTCLMIDRAQLRKTGPLALYAGPGGLRLVASRQKVRPWTGPVRQ